MAGNIIINFFKNQIKSLDIFKKNMLNRNYDKRRILDAL